MGKILEIGEDSRLKGYTGRVTHAVLPLERTFCSNCGRPWGWAPALNGADGGRPAASPSSKLDSSNSAASNLQAVIPAQDLKPLYDFSLDCKACQAKLAACQADLADEKLKTSALTKERDRALQIARGGSSWQRISRAAKWLLIGAAAGAVAAKNAH
jgi:hypothetical protein